MRRNKKKNLKNIILTHKIASLVTSLIIIGTIVITVVLLNNNSKREVEVSDILAEPEKKMLSFEIDTMGIEVGKEIAVFENKEIEKSETNKTFTIISLEDSEFENATKDIDSFDVGQVTEKGFNVETANEDLIKLAGIEVEKLPAFIIVINSKAAQNNDWDIEKDAKDTKVEEKKKTGKSPYYIKVSYTVNVVAIYGKDENDEYTKLVKTMVCSTGISTPKGGTYASSYKYRWLPLFGGVYGQYCTRITGNILFHSVPYLRAEVDSLEYWEYDKLGTAASAGCIRLTVIDAKWIYENCPSGTYVEFCTTLDVPKPSAQKISSNENCRNYDPTDPVEGNPWRTYNQEKPQHQVNPIPNPKPEPTKEPEPELEQDPISEEDTNIIDTNNITEDTNNVGDNNENETVGED